MHSLSRGWKKALVTLSVPGIGHHYHRNHFKRQLRFEKLEQRQVLAAVMVDTNTDVVDSVSLNSIAALIASPGTDGKVTLREAILAANADTTAASDTITFHSSLSGSEILLNHASGQLTISSSLIIDAGDLATSITIKPVNTGVRIFNIADPSFGVSPPIVQMIGLTLSNANLFNPNSQGGAIRSEGILTLSEMIIRNNNADFGGGMYLAVAGGGSARDILTIDQSTLQDNLAYVNGGGVFVQFTAASGAHDTVKILGSTLLRNETFYGYGGGLFTTVNSGSSASHSIIVSSTNFSLNEAARGGAIYHESNSRVDLSILQGSSISGNRALNGRGGGVYANAFAGSLLRFENSTISGNNSVAGGGGAWVNLNQATSLTLVNATISGNTSPGDGGGLAVILKQSSSLTIDSSSISGNTSNNDGGGVFARAYADIANPFPSPRAITISRTEVSGNTAWSRGGGLYAFNYDGTESLIEDSRVTSNHVPNNGASGRRNGGGIYAYLWDNSAGARKPKFTIAGSTLDNNDADNQGGGIFVCAKFNGNFVAINSTISANRTVNQSTGGGGGILIARVNAANESVDAYLRNVTVTQNTSASGGGIMTKNLANVRVQVANSIVSQNFNHLNAANNIVGRLDVANTKYNLVGTGSTILGLNGLAASLDSTNFVSDAPQLGALSSNGGLTPTHALLAGSPAIDAGSNALATVPLSGPPETALVPDQRGSGFQRVFDFPGVLGSAAGPVDIGAYEVGYICVSTTIDELDSDLRYGDVSLREAVNFANNAGVPTTICLPAGMYYLTLSGTGGVSQGDLDVTGIVTIIGDGPGLSVINASTIAIDDRIFDIAVDKTLVMAGITLTLGDAPNVSTERNGGAIRVQNGGHLAVDYSAIVANITGRSGDGGAIYFASTATGSIERSVITANEADDNTGGVHLQDATGTGGTVTLASTIIANNIGGASPDFYVGTGRMLTSQGNNRLTTGAFGFSPHATDYILPSGAVVHYVVTSVADTYDGSSDPGNMSLRDAIHQANTTAGAQEIWLPAWEFVLTRDRVTYGGATDTSVAYGDLDIGKGSMSDLGGSLTIRGVNGSTSVGWAAGAPQDKVFELLGDYDNDGVPNVEPSDVNGADEVMLGLPASDGDDDGDFTDDDDDEQIYTWNYGTQLMLYGIS